jgi:hypothetical protein
MQNGTMGQLRKYVRAVLAGSAYGVAGGALYAAVWGLTHWGVSGKGLSPAVFVPWFLLIGATLGLVAGLGWAASGRRQPQVPAEAGGRRPVPGTPGRVSRIGDTALLRRMGG